MSLELEGVGLTRGNFELKNINLNVAENTVLGIGGKNGSGKTTLIRVMYGFLHRDSGIIRIDDKVLEDLKIIERARKLSIVNQDISEPFNFTVEDVVSLSGYSLEKKKDIQDALDLCGIGYLRNRSFSEISGGEKRLVIIAAAIHQDAKYVIMDEPTAFLDVDKELRVMNIIRSLKKNGRTVILVMHDVNLIYTLCDNVALIKDGSIIAAGPTRDTMTTENMFNTFGVRFRIYDNGTPYRFIPESEVGAETSRTT